MAEATQTDIQSDSPTTSTTDSKEQHRARARDLGRMRRNGALHGTVVLAALAIFGAATQWAATGLVIAQLVALGVAYAAASIIASIGHEWGHLAGARAAGAISPALKKPARYFFVFEFDMEKNSLKQFYWMSIGGMAANWLLVIAGLILIPLNTYAGALLVATLIGKAVNVCVFEIPVVLRTRESENPQAEIDAGLAKPNRLPGRVVGTLAWLTFV